MLLPSIEANDWMHFSVMLLSVFPNRSITDKAWRLLTVLVASILPSETLLPYVEYYVENADNTTNTPLATRCHHYLLDCKRIGSRKKVPSSTELDSLFVYPC